MKVSRVLAEGIGLAACVAQGWGIHGVLIEAGKIGGSCGDTGQPACPSSMTPYIIALSVGLPVAIIAAVAGGKIAGFGIFLSVGIGALATALDGGDSSFALVFGGLFTLGGLLPLLLLPFRLVKRSQAMDLVTTGRPGIGTVTNIEDTGVRINDNPRLRVIFRIAPRDGSPAFDAEKKMTVPVFDVPRVGQRYPVMYDPARPSRFILITKVEESAPEQFKELFRQAVAEQARAAQAAAQGAAGPVPPPMGTPPPVDTPPAWATQSPGWPGQSPAWSASGTSWSSSQSVFVTPGPGFATPGSGFATPESGFVASDPSFGAPASAVPGQGSTGPGAPGGAQDTVDALTKLNVLRMTGGLTEAEYEEQKRRILGQR
jgi:hypothetical protein